MLKEIGKAENGITVNQLTISPTKVRVYGRKSMIDTLTAIPLEVDLSKITESKTYEFEVKLPEGVTKISDPKIKVKADITKVEQEKQQRQQLLLTLLLLHLLLRHLQRTLARLLITTRRRLLIKQKKILILKQ